MDCQRWKTCRIRRKMMRMESTRKCIRIDNFSRSSVDALRNTNSQYQVKLALIQQYEKWVQDHLDNWWDGYLFTFMFNHLSGTDRAVGEQMERDITKWYGRLATRTVRNPRSPGSAGLLPKGVFVRD